MARVLIAGCGYVGRECAGRLAAAGEDVTALRRTPAQTKEGNEGFRAQSLDLGDRSSCERFFSGAPAFDALIVTIAASSGDEAGYRAAYVEALQTLCDTAGPAHPRPPLLLFTSSTSVYAQDDGEWIDEASATEPRGFRGRIQLEAEAIVSRWPGAHAVLRLGGIYGPTRSAFARRVRDGEVPASEGDPYTNRIHRDDAAGALIHLLRKYLAGDRLDPVYLGVDNAPVLRSEIEAWLARGFASTNEVHRGRARSGKRCLNTRLRRSGFRFNFPTYREGYCAVLGADPEFAGFTPPSP